MKRGKGRKSIGTWTNKGDTNEKVKRESGEGVKEKE